MVALYGLLRGESGVDAGDGYQGGAHESALIAHGHAHASEVWSRPTQSRAHAGGGRRARGCEYASYSHERAHDRVALTSAA